MTRKTLYADDVKAAIENCFQDGFDYPCDAARQAALAAIESLPAAEPTKWEELRKYITTLGAGRSDYFDAADDCLGKMAELDGLTWEQHLEKHRQCPAAEPDAGEKVARPPMLLASIGDGSRDVWWTRQGDDLWESQRIFGVSTHAGSKSLIVDRTASDEAALRLYDQDLAESRTSMKE